MEGTRARAAHGLPAAWLGIVAAGGVLSAMSAPGQTAGLSVFTDPIIADLGISRSGVSLSYLIGTLIGALALPFLGRAMDRWSLRATIAGIGLAFAGFLYALSFVVDATGLTLGFTGIRLAGQGALSLAATTLVARSITRHRGLALGLSSAIGSGGISIAPFALSGLVAGVGIQAAWRLEAFAVLCIVVPTALLLRGASGRKPPVRLDAGFADADGSGWTLAQASRTAMFWMLVAGVSVTGLLTTALAFHQISVLGAQGLGPVEAAANFLPQTISGIAATLGAGALADRIAPKYCVTFSMAAMAAALLLVPSVSPGWPAIAFGLVLGAAGGSLRGIEAAAFSRYFGTVHIGSIRGFATSIGLAATALGPILLSLARDVAGNYVGPLLVFAALPLVVGVVSVLIREPRALAAH